VLWLSEGDAHTRFFHAQASVRHRYQFIRSLEHDGRTLVGEESKATMVFEFFDSIMGSAPTWSCSISLRHLDLLQLELGRLTDCFTEVEVWAAIISMPPDKASGPNGFSTRFYQVAWSIIRSDIMRALDTFQHHDMRNMHDVNGALMVLLPKAASASNLKQYRLISLIHSMG
jgi:hypothetical protein